MDIQDARFVYVLQLLATRGQQRPLDNRVPAPQSKTAVRFSWRACLGAALHYLAGRHGAPHRGLPHLS